MDNLDNSGNSQQQASSATAELRSAPHLQGAQLLALQRQLQKQQQDKQRLMRQIAILTSSRSWRLTAPFRALALSIRQLKRRLTGKRVARPAADVAPVAEQLHVRPPDAPVSTNQATVPVDATARPDTAPQHPPVVSRIVSMEAEPWPATCPLVSVVIPCYNYGHYVQEAIDSVLKQTLQNTEIIVVNDGSTDPLTLGVLERLSSPRTRVLHQANGGVSRARNAGIAQARGKYVCCLDADDTIEPTYLEKCVALLEADPGLAFAYSWVRLWGEEQGTWKTEPFNLRRLIVENHVCTAAVFRRAVWELAGGYDTTMNGYEDWEFWIHLGELGCRGYMIPECLFNYRRHGVTLNETARSKHDRVYAYIQRRHARLFAEPELIPAIESGYFTAIVHDPFLNLSDPAIYEQKTAQRRLLFVVPWLIPGGAETLLLSLIDGLSKDGFEFFVLTTLPSDNLWHDRFRELTPNIYHLPSWLPAYAHEDFLINLVRTRQIDTVVVSGSEWGYDMMPVLKEKTPQARIINLLHNDSDRAYFPHSVKLESSIDLHITVNSRIADRLSVVYGISRHKICVIPNGVDTTHMFNPASHSIEHARKLWGLPASKRVVTWIGRLSQEKQPDHFLAMAENCAEQGDTTFVLAGDGPLAGKIQKEIDERALGNNLIWLPGIEHKQVADLLAASDLVVMTSSFEGAPFIPLEALAMGVPVVSYDVGNLRDIVRDGVNGFLVAPGDTNLMVQRVRQLLTDAELLARCRNNARSSIISGGFTVEHMIEQYRRILSKEAACGTRQRGVISSG